MKHQRLILGSVLIILLFSLMLYYSLDNNKHDPDVQYIVDNWEEFTVTKVALDATVKKVDATNNTLYIAVSPYPQGVIQVNTIEPLTNAQTGDPVEVYGTFTGKNQMTAEKILISEQWKYNLIYLRSLPAIPFVLFLFFRTYRFNTNSLRFERRQKHG
jgi:hypothetical protein